MAKEIVVKGFYAGRPRTRKTGAIEYKKASRVFHAREAAERFCEIGNIGAPSDALLRVIEDIGVEPLAKGAGR